MLHLRTTRDSSCNPNVLQSVLPEIRELITDWASEFRTKPIAIYVALLNAVAIAIGHFSRIRIGMEEGRVVAPSMFYVLVGERASGKTATIEKFCTELLSHVEKIFQKKLYISPSTWAGANR